MEGCFYLYNRYKNGKIGIEKRQGGRKIFGSRARGDFKRTSDIDIGRGSYCMKKYENFCASLVNMKTYGFGLCRREIKRNNELDNYGLNIAFSMNNGIINDSNETVFSEIMKI